MTNSGATLTSSNAECECLLRVDAGGHPMYEAGGTNDFQPTAGA